MRRITCSAADYLEARYIPEPNSGCWLWTRGLSDGYGMAQVDAFWPTSGAHRLAYLTYVGPIPEGLVIDHLCRNRACINPAHLEAVTVQVNNQRRYFDPMKPRYRNGVLTPRKMPPAARLQAIAS